MFRWYLMAMRIQMVSRMIHTYVTLMHISQRLRRCLLLLILSLYAMPAVSSPNGQDVDRDGIDDGVEMDLARRFFPVIHFSAGDNCLGPFPTAFPPVVKPVLFRVGHPVGISFASGNQGSIADYITINYVLLYDYDCAAIEHSGDNEGFLILLRYDYGSSDWRFVSIGEDPHRGTDTCEDHTYSNALGSDGRAHVWVGHDKHSNYVYSTHYGCGNDDDIRFPTQDTDISSYALFNIGERLSPIITDLGQIDYTYAGQHFYVGINPWRDQFFEAGYIGNDMLLSGWGVPPLPQFPNPTIEFRPDSVVCQYQLSQTIDQVSTNGGTHSVGIDTSHLGSLLQRNPYICGWRISSSVDWITVSRAVDPSYPLAGDFTLGPYAGAGNGTIFYAVASNPTSQPRTGTVNVGPVSVTVQQSGNGCTFAASPSIATFSSGGGAGTVSVAPSPNDCTWTAAADQGWLTITGLTGSVVSFAVAGNGSGPRSGWIEINGLATSQIVQDGSGGSGGPSGPPPPVFTDDPLVPALTAIRAIHINELRVAINAQRSRYSLSNYAWTDPSIVVGTSTAKAVHLIEMRAALDQAYAGAGMSAPSYSRQIVVGVAITATDVAELRYFVIALALR